MTLVRRVRAQLLRDLPQGFARNVAWQYLSVVTLTGCGFLYTFVVGRTLGVAEFGLMSLGLGFASLLFGVVQVRLHEAVIRFVTEHLEKGELRKAVATVYLSAVVDVLACTIALGAILLLAPVAQVHLMKDSRGVMVVVAAAVTLFLTNIGSATAIGVLRACDRFKWHSVASAGGAVLKLAATAMVFWLFHGRLMAAMVVGAVAGFATNLAIVAAAAVALFHRVGAEHMRAPLPLVASDARPMAAFAGNTYLLSLSGSVLRDLDVNALGWFTSVEVVGTYKVAKSFAALLSQVSDPILFALLPELSRFWVRGERREMKAFLLRITFLGGLAGLAMYLGSAVAVPWLILHVLGPQFHGAGNLFRAMVWWVLLGMPLMWAHSLACAAGRPGLSLRAAVASNALALVLYLALIPTLGGMGAALAYGTGLTTASAISGWLAWRLCLVPMEQRLPQGAVVSPTTESL